MRQPSTEYGSVQFDYAPRPSSDPALAPTLLHLQRTKMISASTHWAISPSHFRPDESDRPVPHPRPKRNRSPSIGFLCFSLSRRRIPPLRRWWRAEIFSHVLPRTGDLIRRGQVRVPSTRWGNRLRVEDARPDHLVNTVVDDSSSGDVARRTQVRRQSTGDPSPLFQLQPGEQGENF